MSKQNVPQKKSGELSKGIVKGTVLDTDGSVKMELREEKLHISKKKVETGKVNMHREILTEEKNIIVPVNREELVIEKIIPDDKNGSRKETLRIPVSEERIYISKRPETIANVSIRNHCFEEVKHINETLKKEIVHIDTKGDVKIIDKKAD